MIRIIKSLVFLIITINLAVITTKNILAMPIVTINSYPQNNIAPQEFDVGFSITSGTPNGTYFIKGLGGENFTNIDTWNSAWLQQNDSWISMPQFLANSEGSISGTIKVRFDGGFSSGSQQFKLRTKRNDADTTYDSEVVSINVMVSTPSPTLTNQPTSAPTQKPATPSPTVKPTLRPTDKPLETNQPEVLSAQTIEPSSTPNVKSAKTKNPLLVIFASIIVIGIVFIGVAGYLAYKIQYNNKNVQEN